MSKPATFFTTLPPLRPSCRPKHEARADHQVTRHPETRAQRATRSRRHDAAECCRGTLRRVEHRRWRNPSVEASRACRSEALCPLVRRTPGRRARDRRCPRSGRREDDVATRSAAHPSRSWCHHHARRPRVCEPSPRRAPPRPRSGRGRDHGTRQTPRTASSLCASRTWSAPTMSLNTRRSTAVATITCAPRDRLVPAGAAGTCRGPRRTAAGSAAPCPDCRGRCRRRRRERGP